MQRARNRGSHIAVVATPVAVIVQTRSSFVFFSGGLICRSSHAFSLTALGFCVDVSKKLSKNKKHVVDMLISVDI
jgi:hypothetical protein